jgi:hypothetical protein
MSDSLFELSIASQAKPFPYGALATAIYINNKLGSKTHPISIVSQPLSLHDPADSSSNAKLLHKSGYLQDLSCYSDCSGATYTGSNVISKTLAEHLPSAGLWEEDSKGVVENASGLLDKLLSSEPAVITQALGSINESMTFKMHPAGNAFTVVDLLLWGGIKGNPQSVSVVLSGKYPEIERWYKEFVEVQPFIAQIHAFTKDSTAVHSNVLLV